MGLILRSDMIGWLDASGMLARCGGWLEIKKKAAKTLKIRVVPGEGGRLRHPAIG
jgi:hypothetical protein